MRTDIEQDAETSQQRPEQGEEQGVSRRAFLGAAAVASAGAALQAIAQTRTELDRGRAGSSASDPGPENTVLLKANPDANLPPFTDRGNMHPIWYSFDLTQKRLQAGGWTHQVTSREISQSRELAGVNMRLTAGSFRELHWHLADEWAIMLTGRARISVMQPDGKMFLDDVGPGDLWYFPAGYPHSIQGLEGDGCEFLLVFDQGDFSEDDTFLLSEFLAHTPPEVVEKNTGWTRQEWDRLPQTALYIFEAALPGPLEEERRFLGKHLEEENRYTFRMGAMPPSFADAHGSVRIVDATNFSVARNIAAAMVSIQPGGIREMHWHPNASEWQYWIKGQGRMTVVGTEAKARTMDFRANDVGFVPAMAGHSIENTGTEELIFLEMFKASRYQDISLNQWMSRMPDSMAKAHLRLPLSTIRRAPQERVPILPR
ncbi:MAG: cupin domain-containing protein [Bacillota bacterium]|nr:cupin domain-containing protein [Bacillota bacterium]